MSRQVKSTVASENDQAARAAETVSLISKKWHPVIIQQLLEGGPLRFNELKEGIDGISAKVLTDSLEDLAENDLIERTVVSEAPLHVEYELTNNGRELQDAIRALAQWGERHLHGDPYSTVLVVDNDPRLANMHASWLEDDYHVERAYDGEDALRKLTEDVDVVLLDRRMPGLSGDEVLARIREWRLDCRVVMLTAVEPDFDIVEMGFDAYIVKPGIKEEVKTVIADVLERDVYDEPVQEYMAVAAKERMLRAEKSAGELAESDEYARLQERLERLEAEIDDVETDDAATRAVRSMLSTESP